MRHFGLRRGVTARGSVHLAYTRSRHADKLNSFFSANPTAATASPQCWTTAALTQDWHAACNDKWIGLIQELSSGSG